MKSRTSVGKPRHLAARVAPILALLAALAGCRKAAIGTDVIVSIDEQDVHYSEFESEG